MFYFVRQSIIHKGSPTQGRFIKQIAITLSYIVSQDVKFISAYGRIEVLHVQIVKKKLAMFLKVLSSHRK
jgi:hypothetical protein